MRFRTLISVLVAFIIIYMVITVTLALGQGGMAWTWWWTIPLGGVFIVAALVFRVLVQRSQEAANRADSVPTDEGNVPTGWPQH